MVVRFVITASVRLRLGMTPSDCLLGFGTVIHLTYRPSRNRTHPQRFGAVVAFLGTCGPRDRRDYLICPLILYVRDTECISPNPIPVGPILPRLRQCVYWLLEGLSVSTTRVFNHRFRRPVYFRPSGAVSLSQPHTCNI